MDLPFHFICLLLRGGVEGNWFQWFLHVLEHTGSHKHTKGRLLYAGRRARVCLPGGGVVRVASVPCWSWPASAHKKERERGWVVTPACPTLVSGSYCHPTGTGGNEVIAPPLVTSQELVAMAAPLLRQRDCPPQTWACWQRQLCSSGLEAGASLKYFRKADFSRVSTNKHLFFF